MARRLPPLNPLRAFEATARHSSLTKAASELSVTHGAVSHQLRALEATLKVRLFERSGQRLKLTAHGAELLPAVAGAFEGIAAATARLTRPTSAGALSVSCVPGLLSLWVLPRLGGFVTQYPNIRLNLIASNDPGDLRSPACRHLRPLRRARLERLLVSQMVGHRAFSGGQPDTDQQPADPNGERPRQPCHAAWR